MSRQLNGQGQSNITSRRLATTAIRSMAERVVPEGDLMETAPRRVDRRARLMLATLGFLRLRGQQAPVVEALHRWLDSWKGIGLIEHGMSWQGYDLQLTPL